MLWPEHLDVGIASAEVNYGVSPGDAHLPEPYAYVGPWTPRTGEFWNTEFGAARPLSALGGADAVLASSRRARDGLMRINPRRDHSGSTAYRLCPAMLTNSPPRRMRPSWTSTASTPGNADPVVWGFREVTFPLLATSSANIGWRCLRT